MKRREFLMSTLAGAMVMGNRLNARQANPPKLARIGIMTFNFNNILKIPGQPADPMRTLEVLDLFDMIADRFGVHNVEMQHAHFASTEPSFLREVKARADRARTRISQINLEFGMITFSAPELQNRLYAIDLTRSWIDHALALGCSRVMINQGQLTPDKKDYSFAALKAMGDYAKTKNVKVSYETRSPSPTGRGRGTPPPDPLPPAPAWVVNNDTTLAWRQANPGAVPEGAQSLNPPAWMLLVEHARFAGTNVTPDIGGMGAANQQQMDAGLRATVPLNAGEVHVNFRDNPQWDLPATVRTIRDLGFTGVYTIEVAGAMDPYAVTSGLMQVVLAQI